MNTEELLQNLTNRDQLILGRTMEWTDRINRWPEPILRDFVNTVYNRGKNRQSDDYAKEKIDLIVTHGAWWWSGTLDSANLFRHYSLITTTTPAKWWKSYDETYNREEVQDA